MNNLYDQSLKLIRWTQLEFALPDIKSYLNFWTEEVQKYTKLLLCALWMGVLTVNENENIWELCLR